MAQQGDDCYFFYYSQCTKGSSCPFRHQEAALGKEIVCNLWKEGHCSRSACPHRHMHIQKDRSQIPCYWQNQPGGCQKPHCVFSHNTLKREAVAVEPVKEALSIVPTLDLVDSTIMKAHLAAKQQKLSQDNCTAVIETPSPKVEQLVINPFEEESDQESMNGTPVKVQQTQRLQEIKLVNKPKVISLKQKIGFEADSITSSDMMSDNRQVKSTSDENIGIKTLEEIQRERAIMSMQQRIRLKEAEKKAKEESLNVQPSKDDEVTSSGRRVIIKTDKTPGISDILELNNIDEGSQSINNDVVKSISNDVIKSSSNDVIKSISHDVIKCVSNDVVKSSRKDVIKSRRKDVIKPSSKEKFRKIEIVEEDLIDKESGSKDDDVIRLHVKDRLGFKSNGRAVDNSRHTPEAETPETAKKVVVSPDRLFRKPPTIERKLINFGINDASVGKVVQTVQVSVKTLTEIKKEKEARSKEDKKITSVRKPRNPIQLYRPPAANRKVDEKSLKSACDNARQLAVDKKCSLSTTRKQPPVDKISMLSDRPKSSDWVAVKSFAEIMREKQERKAKTNLAKYSKDEVGGSNVISNVTKVPSETTHKSNPTASAVNARLEYDNSIDKRVHKFIPVVFDLNDSSQKKRSLEGNGIKIKRTISPVDFDELQSRDLLAEDKPFKQKKFSRESDVHSMTENCDTIANSFIKDSVSQEHMEKLQMKEAQLTSSTVNDLKVDDMPGDDSHKRKPSAEDKIAYSLENVKYESKFKRRFSQRSSASETRGQRISVSSLEVKNEKDISSERAKILEEDDDDLFTKELKELDDLFIGIDSIPNDLRQNEDILPANDDELYLEMTKLLDDHL